MPAIETPAELISCCDELPLPKSFSAEFPQVTCEPGSFAYLPFGTWHQTEVVGEDHCIAIALHVPQKSWTDLLLEHLHGALNKKAEWRAPIIGYYGDSEMRSKGEKELEQLL